MDNSQTIRARFERALAGEPIEWPFYCFVISEDVPPRWQEQIPAVLEAIEQL